MPAASRTLSAIENLLVTLVIMCAIDDDTYGEFFLMRLIFMCISTLYATLMTVAGSHLLFLSRIPVADSCGFLVYTHCYTFSSVLTMSSFVSLSLYIYNHAAESKMTVHKAADFTM